MQRNFGIAVAQTVLLGVLVLAVLFSAAQKNHLEDLVIETNRQLGEMSESIDRLKQSVESGAIRVAAAPGSAAATAGAFPGSQYYSAEELEGLMAPGNFLSPPTTSIREGGTEGGTIHRAALSDIPGLNMLTVNAADVSEIYHYIADRGQRRLHAVSRVPAAGPSLAGAGGGLDRRALRVARWRA